MQCYRQARPDLFIGATRIQCDSRDNCVVHTFLPQICRNASLVFITQFTGEDASD